MHMKLVDKFHILLDKLKHWRRPKEKDQSGLNLSTYFQRVDDMLSGKKQDTRETVCNDNLIEIYFINV